MKNTYKCKYKYCKCGGEVLKEEAVSVGKQYYHKVCLDEKNNKAKIEEIYYKYYKSTEQIQMIRRTISNLIDLKGFDSEYILYSLCQAIKQKIPMKSIYGLHYIVSNNDIKESYSKLKANQKTKDISFDNVDTVQATHTTYSSKKKKTWSDTLFAGR